MSWDPGKDSDLENSSYSVVCSHFLHTKILPYCIVVNVKAVFLKELNVEWTGESHVKVSPENFNSLLIFFARRYAWSPFMLVLYQLSLPKNSWKWLGKLNPLVQKVRCYSWKRITSWVKALSIVGRKVFCAYLTITCTWDKQPLQVDHTNGIQLWLNGFKWASKDEFPFKLHWPGLF